MHFWTACLLLSTLPFAHPLPSSAQALEQSAQAAQALAQSVEGTLPQTAQAILAQSTQTRLVQSTQTRLGQSSRTAQRQDFPPVHNVSALLELHRALIRIDSTTGLEHNVGVFLKTYLEHHNLTVQIQTLPAVEPYPNAPPRYNLLAWPGKRHGRHAPILLTSHLDTVPPFFNYSLEAAGETIYGRGANDAKGCVAAQTRSCLELLARGDVEPDDVALLFVVGEETGGDGMRAAAQHLDLKPEVVIFGEPTEQKLVAGHKGFTLFELTATGKAAHSGYPWLGRNAISSLLPALTALEQLQDRLPRSDLLGPSTLNIGRIDGGAAANVVPAKATASGAVRIGGGTPEQVHALIEQAVHSVAPDVQIRFPISGYAPPVCDTDVDGFESTTVNYGTDIPNFPGHHRKYLYGAGSIFNAHGPQEHVRAGQLVEAAQGYQQLVKTAKQRLAEEDHDYL